MVEQTELEELKKQITKINERDERISHLETELAKMKDRYIDLLEHQVKQQKQVEIPKEIPKQKFQLSNFQLLILLKESKANSRQFAVTASQLKIAFTINRSARTIRNKLAELEAQGFVTHIGAKPKAWSLTPAGIELIEKQGRTALQVGL